MATDIAIDIECNFMIFIDFKAFGHSRAFLRILEPSWRVLGRLWGVYEASLRRQTQQERGGYEFGRVYLSPYPSPGWDHLGTIFGWFSGWLFNIFLIISLKTLWHLGVLRGASWGYLGPSWGSLGGVLRRLWGVLGSSWAVLGPSWDPLLATIS